MSGLRQDQNLMTGQLKIGSDRPPQPAASSPQPSWRLHNRHATMIPQIFVSAQKRASDTGAESLPSVAERAICSSVVAIRAWRHPLIMAQLLLDKGCEV
jgi:hypothetical protein